jgi:hypothetical protein
MFKTLLLAACLAFSLPASASVTSDQQGLHQWPALDGKLILVNGTYQDTSTYKRSLTFYFQSKADAEWLHVPLIDSDGAPVFTWFSISQGEQTVADAAVVARAGGVELVVAETRPGMAAPITVRTYRLAEAGDDMPDGPAYYFKKISATRYPASATLTVEQVLKKEVTSRSKK